MESGAARGESKKDCRLPSFSPRYFFLRKQNIFIYLYLHNYRQYIRTFGLNNFFTKNGNMLKAFLLQPFVARTNSVELRHQCFITVSITFNET